jgi:hypothetical protein
MISRVNARKKGTMMWELCAILIGSWVICSEQDRIQEPAEASTGASKPSFLVQVSYFREHLKYFFVVDTTKLLMPVDVNLFEGKKLSQLQTNDVFADSWGQNKKRGGGRMVAALSTGL